MYAKQLAAARWLHTLAGELHTPQGQLSKPILMAMLLDFTPECTYVHDLYRKSKRRLGSAQTRQDARFSSIVFLGDETALTAAHPTFTQHTVIHPQQVDTPGSITAAQLPHPSTSLLRRHTFIYACSSLG